MQSDAIAFAVCSQPTIDIHDRIKEDWVQMFPENCYTVILGSPMFTTQYNSAEKRNSCI